MAYAYRASSSAGNASGGALSVNKPTGTANGDLLVAVLYLESDTNTFSSVPTGWSLAGSIANTGEFKIWVYWKVASGEPASWSWTPTTNAWRAFTVDAYSGGTSPAVDVVGTGGQGDGQTDNNQLAPSLTTTAANDILIFGYGNFNGTNPDGMVGAASNLRIAFGGCTIADANIATASATGTSHVTGTGTQDFAAIHISWLLGSGGTTFTLSVAGSLTSSGAIAKQDSKLVAGTLSSSGLLSKQESKLLNGSLTSSGRLQNQANKLLTGTLTSAGSLIKQVGRVLQGNLTSSGAISKQESKLLSGILTSSGVLIKQCNKVLKGTLSSAGLVSNIKIAILTIGGTLGSSGQISKQVSKLTSGTLTSNGSLLKQISKFLSGVLSSIGTFFGVKSGTTVILAGFDIADTRHNPIFFEQSSRPVLYSDQSIGFMTDTRSVPVLTAVSKRPFLYDTWHIAVQYDNRHNPIWFVQSSRLTIYGEDL